jgi:hypothetical protein
MMSEGDIPKDSIWLAPFAVEGVLLSWYLQLGTVNASFHALKLILTMQIHIFSASRMGHTLCDRVYCHIISLAGTFLAAGKVQRVKGLLGAHTAIHALEARV